MASRYLFGDNLKFKNEYTEFSRFEIHRDKKKRRALNQVTYDRDLFLADKIEKGLSDLDEEIVRINGQMEVITGQMEVTIADMSTKFGGLRAELTESIDQRMNSLQGYTDIVALKEKFTDLDIWARQKLTEYRDTARGTINKKNQEIRDATSMIEDYRERLSKSYEVPRKKFYLSVGLVFTVTYETLVSEKTLVTWRNGYGGITKQTGDPERVAANIWTGGTYVNTTMDNKDDFGDSEDASYYKNILGKTSHNFEGRYNNGNGQDVEFYYDSGNSGYNYGTRGEQIFTWNRPSNCRKVLSVNISLGDVTRLDETSTKILEEKHV